MPHQISSFKVPFSNLGKGIVKEKEGRKKKKKEEKSKKKMKKRTKEGKKVEKDRKTINLLNNY